MNYSIKFVFVFLFISIFVQAKEEDIYFYHLTPRDGLSQVNILSIYQDEFGTMWFGTTEGLDRYNGQTFEAFKPSMSTGLQDNTIYAITGDKKGNLFVMAGSDLLRFDLIALKFELLETKVRAMAFCENRLWIVRGRKLMLYDEGKKEFILHTKLKIAEADAFVIYPTQAGTIWLGTSHGLVKIDAGGNRTYMLDNNRISYLYKDRRNNLWAASASNGVFVIKPSGEIVNYKHDPECNSLSNNQVRDILEDEQGKIWIATFYGLNQFDPLTQQWKSYVHNDNNPHSLSHSSIFPLYKDMQGTMWIGTYFGGINYFNPESDIFRYYGANSADVSYLSFPYVGRMVEDKYHHLWICTEGGNLNCFDLHKRTFSRYSFDNARKYARTLFYNQKCIWYREDKDLLYIGMHNEGLAVFNIKTKQARIIGNDKSGQLLNASNNTINDMQYYDGRLVLMTREGLVSMDIDKETFHPFSDVPQIREAIGKAKKLTFHIDTKNRLWLVTNGLLCIHLTTHQIKEYFYDPHNKCSIGKCAINSIYESHSGDIYFSSMGSGIFKYNPSSDDFENYTEKKHGLISDYCYSISETPSGYLLLLHNKGLSLFDPHNAKSGMFRSSSHFPILGFNTGNSVYVTNRQEIFIGGMNGLVSFFERDLYKINRDYNLYFDHLFIDNNLVTPHDETRILSKILALCDEIELESSQNKFKIEFASSSYLQSMTHNYEYRLEGFDTDWIRTDSRLISYTNIDPGKYILEVREVGNPDKMCRLKIKIIPPFWQSTLAWFLYCILALLLLLGGIKFYLWRSRIQAELEFEFHEKERIKELNQTKQHFFTNVAHEFRTPLTLIVGHVESLLSQSGLDRVLHARIEKIYKNTHHLLGLVTELLHFSKQEEGGHELKVEQVALIPYIRGIYEQFKEYAVRKNIKYKMEYSDQHILVYIDPEYFRKAIYNLLSNAFKYTSDKGEISIWLGWLHHRIAIRIRDNGIGISAQHLDKIFERFYQLEYRASGTTLGTGIGLAFTREIVTAHQGEIKVESIPDEGSVFTILLQPGLSHFSKEQFADKTSLPPFRADVVDEDMLFDWEKSIPEPLSNLLEEVAPDAQKASLLIVDDDDALIDLVADVFGRCFHIYKASNGKDAFDIVLREEPDIVLSDVLMPDMSGKELCYKIKNNVNVSHIPVVLLTGQTSENQIVDGYMLGADAYIIKPFNIHVLLSICNSLIRNRRILHKKIIGLKPDLPALHTIIEEDQRIMIRATEVIEENLTNDDFDMNKLSRELGLGRSQFYLKMKEITGMTPNQLTLNVRLKKAVALLEGNSRKNISEIAFELGFSSAKYFSKCFKNLYGITPQEWRKRNQNN